MPFRMTVRLHGIGRDDELDSEGCSRAELAWRPSLSPGRTGSRARPLPPAASDASLSVVTSARRGDGCRWTELTGLGDALGGRGPTSGWAPSRTAPT